jgi:hypothetical protein
MDWPVFGSIHCWIVEWESLMNPPDHMSPLRSEPINGPAGERTAPPAPRHDSPLRRLSHFLALLPASGYALLFLATVPLFAALYHYVLPDEFYSDTVTHEAHYHRQVRRLQVDLQDTLIYNLGATYGTYAVPVEDGRFFCVDRLQILEFAISDARSASLSLALPSAPEVPGTPRCSRETIDRVDVLDGVVGFSQAFLDNDYSKPDLAFRDQLVLAIGFTSSQAQDAAMRLFPAPPVTDTFAPSQDRVLYWTTVAPSTARLTRELLGASQGDPSSLPGGYWRMLYMSAIATTTTGFGDIVPVTTRARMITIAEVFVGVVLVGLFLNALVVRKGVG